MPSKTKKPRLEPTEKQKRQAKEFVKSGNITQSGLKAYKTTNPVVAYKLAKKNLSNPVVKSYIEKILNKGGLSDEEITKQLRTIIYTSTKKHSLQKVSPSDGLKGIEMVLKLKDRFPAERKQVSKAELKVKLEGKTAEELAQVMVEQRAELKKWQKLIKG